MHVCITTPRGLDDGEADILLAHFAYWFMCIVVPVEYTLSHCLMYMYIMAGATKF